MGKLVDMRRSKKERKRLNEVAVVGEESAIPHGLSITLDDESLSKLGIKELPNVGDRMVVAAIGVVNRVSQYDSKRNQSRDVSIDLEKLDVSPVPARKVKTAEDAVSEAIKDV